jgi:hypothetical protein
MYWGGVCACMWGGEVLAGERGPWDTWKRSSICVVWHSVKCCLAIQFQFHLGSYLTLITGMATRTHIL